MILCRHRGLDQFEIQVIPGEVLGDTTVRVDAPGGGDVFKYRNRESQFSRYCATDAECLDFRLRKLDKVIAQQAETIPKMQQALDRARAEAEAVRTARQNLYNIRQQVRD